MKKTASDILLEAASLLEEEGRWCKGVYFYPTANGCQMCAHGAISYCGNPFIRENIVGNLPLNTAQANTQANYGWSVSVSVSPDYATNLHKAHQQADKVGLTIAWNDAPERTKQEVIAKLREAAQLSI